MKTEKKIYIECLENDGVLYHEDGYKMTFEHGVFKLSDKCDFIDIIRINPDGWSKTEPIEKFDVVWEDNCHEFRQYVYLKKGYLLYLHKEDGVIYKGFSHCENPIKCKQSEIHPIIAKFRERCIKEFKG